MNKLKIICCIDNDKKLWGTFTENILTMGPEFLNKIEFDEVIVTTQWSQQVRKQLIDLGISDLKIVIPDRRIISPQQFESEMRQRIGINVIKQLVKVFSIYKIDLVVDMGTLLGLYRDGRLISWDNDVDFMLFHYDMEQAFQILGSLMDKDYSEYSFENLVVSKNNDLISQIEFSCSTFPFDEPGFPITINARENRDNLTVWVKFPDLWSAPREHFESLEYLDFEDSSFPIPALTEKYLAHIYGPDWRTPRPSFTYSDYPNQ